MDPKLATTEVPKSDHTPTVTLQEYIQQISTDLRGLSLKQDDSNRRLLALEKEKQSSEQLFGPSGFGTGQPGRFYSHLPDEDAHNPTISLFANGEGAVVDSMKEYDSISENLRKQVKLPSYMKVPTSQTGISQENKSVLKVASKCTNFAETGLRWIANIYQKYTPHDDKLLISEEDLQTIFHILLAQVGYLKGEYTNLVVQSTFDSNTAKYFRQFENNQSSFTPSSLQNVRVAAELAAISNRQSAPRGRGYRGRDTRGGRAYGGYRNQSYDDGFSRMTRRNIPNRRPGYAEPGNTEMYHDNQ